jgi:hypothetical protein
LTFADFRRRILRNEISEDFNAMTPIRDDNSKLGADEEPAATFGDR